MDRIKLFLYNPKNWDDIITKIVEKKENIKVLSSQELNVIGALQKALSDKKEIDAKFSFKEKFYDLSLVMSGDGDRVDIWSGSLILLLDMYFSEFQQALDEKIFIVDKKYAKDIVSVLYYFFEGTESLEKVLGLDERSITNIVDLEDNKIDYLNNHLQTHLFGNGKFKTRLIEELKRFRLFNKLGERKIFSAFVCGPSGIGKTHTAKLLHDCLAPGEKYIKINLGNYSDHNALSSLIGSPRGYVGSSKGELSSKIDDSKSTVILIDEFEKASQEVHNFFLELLSDGKFTDSQGREFDLNKYIIIFTSNMTESDFQTKVSPELRSRFDLLYRMVLLGNEEKKSYANYKAKNYIEKVRLKFDLDISLNEVICPIQKKILQLDNIRFITKEIEQSIALIVETKLNK